MYSFLRKDIILKVVVLFIILGIPAIPAASFQGLGFLPGYTSSYANGVSADGSVIVGRAQSSYELREAMRWTQADGMVGLGFLPGGSSGSYATDVSADGSVIVGSSPTLWGQESFRWTESGGMEGLGYLPGGNFYNWAYAISGNGLVVVGVSQTGSFRWTESGGMVSLGVGYPSAANGVSADGSVVVGYSRMGTDEAFRWTESGGMVGLGFLPQGTCSYANGVSADGSVIVGRAQSSFGSEAFRWTESGGMVGLGFLPGGSSYVGANGVSADGSVVVGHSDTSLGNEAFIWDSTHGMRNLKDVLVNDYGLDLTGWTLTTSTSISDDGMIIVGNGTNPIGNTEAWRAERLDPGISINSGAQWTKTAAVTLTLCVYFRPLGTGEMRFSNDNSTWSDWESYTTSKTWSLQSGVGIRNVYVQYKDNTGNITTYEDSIRLDPVVPTSGTALSPANVNVAPIVVTYTGAGDSGGSGLKEVRLYFKKEQSGTWTDTGLTAAGTSGAFNFTPTESIGRYYFDLVAEDNAGNKSASASGDGDTSTQYTAAIVQGSITLRNWPRALEGMPAVIDIRDGTGAIVETKNVILDANGGFSFVTNQGGAYTAVAKAWHWLAKAEPLTITGSSDTVSFQLTNGDCNGDNGVDEIDYAMLSNAWYTAKGDLRYNANADLNGDEGIDELDYAILSGAWYTAGD